MSAKALWGAQRRWCHWTTLAGFHQHYDVQARGQTRRARSREAIERGEPGAASALATRYCQSSGGGQ